MVLDETMNNPDLRFGTPNCQFGDTALPQAAMVPQLALMSQIPYEGSAGQDEGLPFLFFDDEDSEDEEDMDEDENFDDMDDDFDDDFDDDDEDEDDFDDEDEDYEDEDDDYDYEEDVDYDDFDE